MRSTKGTICDILSDEMIVNLNMLSPHVEGVVAGDEGGCLIIAVHLHRQWRRKTEFNKKRP